MLSIWAKTEPHYTFIAEIYNLVVMEVFQVYCGCHFEYLGKNRTTLYFYSRDIPSCSDGSHYRNQQQFIDSIWESQRGRVYQQHSIIQIITNGWGGWQWHCWQITVSEMAAIMADDIFKCIFFHENDRITIQISLEIVPSSPIDNKCQHWFR